MRRKSVWICLFTLLFAAGCAAVQTGGSIEEPGIAIIESTAVPGETYTSSESTAESAEETEETEEAVDLHPYDFTVCFAGDVNFSEKWCTMLYCKRQENGIEDCIDETLIREMQAADIFCLNNEFTYSDRGEPLAGKTYTFRANPERVEILHTLGVDIVTLANNHVYDYGKTGILDTFDTLEAAEIPYFGAGRNLEEASKPVYLTVQGKTIAFVGASRAEKNKMTPQATEDSPGILRCYDPELYREAIAQGSENADFCIAMVHWGTEYSEKLEAVQVETGQLYLEAGADAVIGAHTHCLQGFWYEDNKAIAYSLGNFWFNEKTQDTMLLSLHFYGDDTEEHMELKVIPALQKGYTTTYVEDAAEQRRVFDSLEKMSAGIHITDEGYVESIAVSGQEE